MSASIDIDKVYPEAERIFAHQLEEGMTVFDVWGTKYIVTHVRHTARNTFAQRSDGDRFVMPRNDTITVIR